MTEPATFHWLVERSSGEVTIGRSRSDKDWWTVLGGIEGWCPRAEIEAHYEIVGEANPPMGAVEAVRSGYRVPS